MYPQADSPHVRNREIPDSAHPPRRLLDAIMSFLIPIAMVVVFGSLFMYPIAKNYIYSDGIDTTAVVTQISKGKDVCSITAQFDTPAGSVTRASTYADLLLCRYQPGQVIDITYSQFNPSLWRPSGIPWALIPVGLFTFGFLSIVMLGGIAGFRRSRRTWRTQHPPDDTGAGRV